MRKLLLFLVGMALTAGPVSAATPNFTEDFAAGTAGFAGGAVVTHVLGGGVGGATDPFLEVSTVAAPVPGNLGTSGTSADLTGDLSEVGGYSFWLQDTGQDDALEIHVAVGIQLVNVWLSIDGFAPPAGGWAEFSVDLRNPSGWVQIIGTGTFEEALAGSAVLLLRHDVAPLTLVPDIVNADFALDRITVLPGPSTVPALSRGGVALLVFALISLLPVLAAPLGRSK